MVSELAGEGDLPLPTLASHAELHRFGEDRSTVLFFQSSTSRSMKFLSKMLISPMFTVFNRSRSENSLSKVLDYPPSIAFNRSPWSRSMESVGENMSTVLISSTSVVIIIHGVDSWQARAQSSLILRQWPHNSIWSRSMKKSLSMWSRSIDLRWYLLFIDVTTEDECKRTWMRGQAEVDGVRLVLSVDARVVCKGGFAINLGSETIHRTELKLAKVRVEIDVTKHMQKCVKCFWEFCSPVNSRRHVRLHRRSLHFDKESRKYRGLLGAFWDKLTLEEVKKVASLNDVSLKEIIGTSLVNGLSMSICKAMVWTIPSAYVKAGSALLETIQKRCKNVFDGEVAKVGLDMKNLLACTCFLLGQKLVKAWLVDKDAEALRCQKLLVGGLSYSIPL
nr:uncharacterized protein LOC109146521 [Ipomoea batatas]